MKEKRYSKREILKMMDNKLRVGIEEKKEDLKCFTGLFDDFKGEDVDIPNRYGKRFNSIMNFLSRPEIRKALGDSEIREGAASYFYSEEMTVSRARNFKGKNNAYQLNVSDTFFIIGLMVTFNHEAFSSLRNKKPSIFKTDVLIESWVEDFGQVLELSWDILKGEMGIEESGDLRTLKINLTSLLYRFSPLIEKHNQGIYGDLAGIGAAFEALPEELKEEVYNEKLKRSLNKMKKELTNLIEELKTSEDQGYYKEFKSNFDLEYDVYEALNQLPKDHSMDDLFSFLKGNFYDPKNENRSE